jgi:hypothetical protein
MLRKCCGGLEATAHALCNFRAYAEETNRLNRERRASGEDYRMVTDEAPSSLKQMLSVIGEGGRLRPRAFPGRPHPSRRLDRDGERVIMKLVAGTGFEPVTFRL